MPAIARWRAPTRGAKVRRRVQASHRDARSDPAHKVTRANDFINLSAPLRNFCSSQPRRPTDDADGWSMARARADRIGRVHHAPRPFVCWPPKPGRSLFQKYVPTDSSYNSVKQYMPKPGLSRNCRLPSSDRPLDSGRPGTPGDLINQLPYDRALVITRRARSEMISGWSNRVIARSVRGRRKTPVLPDGL